MRLYSIGHSDHSVEALVSLLQRCQVRVLVDVRSQPYSQWTPQFNRESLARDLEAAGLRYVFLGDALGGRPAERALYDPGQERPNYERLSRRPVFQAGLDRLLELAAEDQVAFMCSEGDYKRCHRTLLITPALLARGAQVLHIQPDGTTIEAQPEFRQTSLF
jgi:uncharacterized protein (DUF488 family)